MASILLYDSHLPMIIKTQSILFPYARQKEDKKPVQIAKKNRVNADRVVMILLFIVIIIVAVIFS